MLGKPRKWAVDYPYDLPSVTEVRKTNAATATKGLARQKAVHFLLVCCVYTDNFTDNCARRL